ncbi:MAG: pitrilysin family protein [Gemmatimonadota bacterium]
MEQQTYEKRLDNGLTVVVREDHSAPVVAVVTRVGAGYFDEPDAVAGISHVLEHMYFKGTARRGAGEIARETKSAGGYLNAGTIYDHTTYYTVLPSSSLEQALDIQSDALQHSAIDDEELRRELLVIIQEAKRKRDNPGAVAQETLYETMFDAHRIRRWRIGTEAVLGALTRADVAHFYRSMYRAANTIVVVAGAVDPARAFELVERCYGGMAAGEPARDRGPDEPERRGFRYREIVGDITQSRLEWGWRTPGIMHEDTPALDVLAIALGQGRASRLYRHVRDAGVTAAVSARNYTPTAPGAFGIGAELDPPDTDAAFERIAAVLRDVRTGGFTAAEVERARNILEARHLRRLETVEGQANLIADWQAHGDWRLAEAYLDRALSVTARQLHHAAQRYLDSDALTVLLYRPYAAPAFAGSAMEVQSRLGTRLQLVATPAPAKPTVARLADAATLRPVRVEDGVHFYDAGECGARIVIKPRSTVPLVSVALCCRGGALAEHTVTAGTTGLMARTSVRGTRTRSASQIAEESESLGAGIASGAGADTVEWTTLLPARHFERGVDLLLDAALEPVFPGDEAERERKILLSGLEHVRDDMHEYPLRIALAQAFGGHPYGFELAELESAVRAADVSGLQAWHEDTVLRGAPHVFAVGDIAEPDRAAGLIAARMRGRLKEPSGREPVMPEWPMAPLSQAVFRDKAQTALVLAFPGPPRNHDDVYALQVLSAAISGLGGRLFEELRSRQSLAYAVSAAPMARWLGGAFIAYIGTAPEREEEARTELLRELARTAVEPLQPDELERAKRHLIGAWQIRQQTNGRQLAELSSALLLGGGLVELRGHEERVRAVSGEDVRAAAARWLRPERLVEGIVRGA